MNAVTVTESHIQLVRKVAGQVARRLPRHVGMDELLGAGALGLVDAAQRFDPSRGVEFGAYAAIRIQGAILDELRAIDFVPRRVRNRDDAIEAERVAAHRAGRPTSDEEIEARLGLAAGTLGAWAAEGRPSFVPYDTASEESQGITGGFPAADAVLEREESIETLKKAISKLAEKLQTVLSLYYVEGLTLKEIGDILHVTESRVCQLHGQAIGKLRETLT
jgi:RNA polymerase sigma factor FliA